MTQESPNTGTGMVLGKFMPPHFGHQHLIDFARHYVKRLTVLVCSLPSEPIPGKVRFKWMQSMFPACDLVHITDELPQEPDDHPDFWDIWRRTIRNVLPTGPNFVFASEPYGYKLAEILGARFIPVDPTRSMVPISATDIRRDPLTHWDYIPPVVRPYYLRRVCIYGPESTGKTTLARDLARHYHTVAVEEHARPLLDHNSGRCDADDIPRIARGQMAAENALATQANRVMFCDTDLLTTTIWSDVLFGSCPQWICDQAAQQHYDLTLLLDVDVPWADDAQRFLPHRRREFFERCEQALREYNRRYAVIRGSWGERFAMARDAVDELLKQPSMQTDKSTSSLE